ncbi:hypothetical protein TRIP_C21122 [Candidatus Zixiibacteriota bacterium]|nr:hypothetical protein TRIP_C21122 [candidate division Zixibacteria bacterium]
MSHMVSLFWVSWFLPSKRTFKCLSVLLYLSAIYKWLLRKTPQLDLMLPIHVAPKRYAD